MRLDVTSPQDLARRAELDGAQVSVLLEMLPAGVVIAEAPSGRIIRGNASLRRILGQGADGAGVYAQARWSDADGKPLPAADGPLAQAVAGQTVSNRLLRLERPDGTLGLARVSARPIYDGNGTIVFALASIDDLQAEQQAQAVLERTVAERTAEPRRAQLRSRTLFEHSPLGILVLQVNQGGVVTAEECNAAFCRTAGLRPEQVAGNRIEQILGDETGASLAADCHICLAQGGFESQQTLKYPSGDRSVRSYYRPLPDLDSDVHRVLLTQIDLTESRRVEAALRQAMRLEAIGQLTGGVAHEFNNLLTAVLGSLELLGRRVTDERQRRWVNTASNAAQRGAALTHQLLAYARKQFLEPAATDIPGSLGALMELFRGSLGGMISLSTDFDPLTWKALADPAQLELALFNLMANARDAMPAGGRLMLSTANRRHGDPDLPAELEPGDYVLLQVADTGIGMPPEVLVRASEPFFTTKGIGEGSGLGLSQAYGVARQLGGTMRLHSRPGEGTTAQMYLPRAA